MGALSTRGFRLASLCALTLAAIPVCADEIRLKDGKKLYGVIVAYEENMFKVKTDFGYVLVEKDKIASIIPAAPTASEAQPAAKNGVQPGKSSANAQPKAESAVANADEAAPSSSNGREKAVVAGAVKQTKNAKTEGKISATAVRPELPTMRPAP